MFKKKEFIEVPPVTITEETPVAYRNVVVKREIDVYSGSTRETSRETLPWVLKAKALAALGA